MNTEEKAQELYPNNKTFCGGVAQIARDAFAKGARMQKEVDDKELSEKVSAAYQLGLADKETEAGTTEKEYIANTMKMVRSMREKRKEQKELPLMGGYADLYFDEWNQQKQNPTKRQCFEEGIRYARRLQKEQKPVWSEEDEDMLNSCISSIEEAKENRYAYKETDGDTSYDHEIAWLKSLRPDTCKICNSQGCKDSLQTWKPSEQEKGALRTAIHVLTEERSFPKAAEKLQAILDAFEGKESRKDWKPSEE